MNSPSFSSSCCGVRRGRRWLTLPPAWPVLLVIALWLCPLLDPAHIAHAMQPNEDVQPAAQSCTDRDELAGVTNAEAGAQLPHVQLRIMQIFVKEAESRGMTFCALSHLTRFSAVRAYVRLHPGSYLEWRLNNPPEDLLLMAATVLLHQAEDVTEGAMHFDGDGMRIIFRP